MKTRLSVAALLAALAVPAPSFVAAQEESGEAMSQGGTGALVNGEGAEIGNASVSLSASGNALVLVQAEGIPEGVHAVHLHMVGVCEGPTFESAGDHVADGHDHGVLASAGPHPGDLPNAEVAADGVMTFEGFAVGMTEALLFDEDGSALIVHTGEDDHASQPSGNAGDRLACAVIEAGGEAGAAREAAEGTEAVEGEAGQ